MADTNRNPADNSNSISTQPVETIERSKKSTGRKLPARALTNLRKQGIVAQAEINGRSVRSITRMTRVPERQVLSVLREYYIGVARRSA